MDRSIPHSNKIVFKRMVDKNRQIHLAKLGNIKSTLSRAAPYSFNQAKTNKKKAQVNEDRLTEIERENRLLLDKLTVIMRSTSQNPVPDQNGRSLNKDSRKRDLVKITIENQAFLRRLQDQKPHYNRELWVQDRRQQEVYLKNISEYPMNLAYLNNSTMGNEEERPKTFQQGHRDKASRFPSFATTMSEKMSASARHPETLKKLQPTKNFRGEKLEPVKPKSTKTMLYQVKKKIGFSNYMIHIYLHNDTFNIMASNNERADLKTMTTSIKEGQDLLLRYNGDYEELINRIRFKGTNIVLGENSLYVESAKKEEHLNGEIVETQDENEVDHHEEERTPKNLNSSHLSKKSNNSRKQESETNLSDSKPQESKSEKEEIKGEDEKQEEQDLNKQSGNSEAENENASLQKIESKSDNGSRKSNADNDEKEKSEKVKSRASPELQNKVDDEEYVGRETPEKESKASEEVQEDYEEEFEG